MMLAGITRYGRNEGEEIGDDSMGVVMATESHTQRSLLVSFLRSREILRFDLQTREWSQYASESAHHEGGVYANLTAPTIAYADPSNPGAYFVIDANSICISDPLIRDVAGYHDTYAFKDGVGIRASFAGPRAVACSRDGTIAVVADSGNHRIRHIHVKTSRVTTVAGSDRACNRDGIGSEAGFNTPTGIVFDRSVNGDDSVVYITATEAIRRLDLDTRTLDPPRYRYVWCRPLCCVLIGC